VNAVRLLPIACCVALLAGCAEEPPRRWTHPTAGIEFVLVPAGDFVAGSPPTEPGHQDDEILYPVRMGVPFYLSVHEITRGGWATVMGTDAPAATDARLPVVNVTWHEVAEFLKRLNQQGQGFFRLPNEIEWEYACRAGTTSAYSTGSTLSTAQANYNGMFPLPGQPPGENRGRLTPAGSFPPNAWGLYDMHGNAWEWTSERYDAERMVIRGGSWRFNADSARCALRYTHRPQDEGDSLGFRIVRNLPQHD
jgi:formylglycine-generating enzyme required for sulfatase activity